MAVNLCSIIQETMDQPRYLIIGASGFIGSRLYSALGPRSAIGTYKTRPVDGGLYFDPLTMRLSEIGLRNLESITHAFLLYAMSDIDACAKHPKLARKVNVDSQKRLIDDLLKLHVVPVFASSDAVFDGTRAMSTEDDAINPVLTYGRQKAEVETYLTANAPAWQVLRLAKVVSSSPERANLLSDWMNRLELGTEIQCATDQIFSPVDLDDVVGGMIALARNKASGIFHMCGPRPISRIDFLRTLVKEIKALHGITEQITECSIRDFDFAEPRPLDVSMSPRKLYAALGRSFNDMALVCKTAAERRCAPRVFEKKSA